MLGLIVQGRVGPGMVGTDRGDGPRDERVRKLGFICRVTFYEMN